MKALNRAIGRTVSQLARHGAEGCHPPMLMALENHLDALLTMERKQLEQAGISIARVGDKEVVNITSTGCGGRADGKAVADWILRELERTKAPEGVVAFSTPQEKNGSLFDRFVANGMMEQDAFRDSGEARKLGITPARIMAQMHQNDGGQMAALEKACEAATNAAREAVRYMNQRDELMDVLVQVSAYHETGKIRHGLDIRQVVNCALEHFRRDGVGHKETAVTTRAFVEHQTKVHAKPLPAETEAQLPPKPVLWYQTGVRSAFDPSLQQQPSAASEQPVPPPPAPDAIDMTDPRNWQANDWIVCKRKSSFGGWEPGTAYRFGGKEGDESVPAVLNDIGDRIPFRYDQLPIFFTWLRHGEAQQ